MENFIFKLLHFISGIIPVTKYRHKLRYYTEYKIRILNGNIGKHSYVGFKQKYDKNLIEIGKYCSIPREVKLGLPNHPIDRLTSHPMTYYKSKYVPFYTIMIECIKENPSERPNIGEVYETVRLLESALLIISAIL